MRSTFQWCSLVMIRLVRHKNPVSLVWSLQQVWVGFELELYWLACEWLCTIWFAHLLSCYGIITVGQLWEQGVASETSQLVIACGVWVETMWLRLMTYWTCGKFYFTWNLQFCWGLVDMGSFYIQLCIYLKHEAKSVTDSEGSLQVMIRLLSWLKCTWVAGCCCVQHWLMQCC